MDQPIKISKMVQTGGGRIINGWQSVALCPVFSRLDACLDAAVLSFSATLNLGHWRKGQGSVDSDTALIAQITASEFQEHIFQAGWTVQRA